MQEIIDDVILEGQQNDRSFCDEAEGQPVARSVEEMREITELEEINERRARDKKDETAKQIATLLQGKGLSGNLVRTLINTEITVEYVRLLKTLDFDDNDIENLQHLQCAMLEANGSSELRVDSASNDSSPDKYLSPDSLYLKNSLSKRLIEGLREIVAKKPADPVEYLGHWLLHYKVCEERNKRRKEEELELLIKREKLRMKEEEGENAFPLERMEEERSSENWLYFDYGE